MVSCSATPTRIGGPEPTAWPLQRPELCTLIWSVAIMAIFNPLASAQYRKATNR